MKKSREELTRIHKEKCRKLKEIRAKMAEDLGIDLHQRECTYQGYCRGTCPACRKEELLLNAALLKKQMEGANLKGRAAAAGLAAAAALCLTGCGPSSQNITTDDSPEMINEDLPGFITPPSDEIVDGYIINDTEGDFLVPDEQSEEEMPEIDQEEGEMPLFPEGLEQPSCEASDEYMELEGDVVYIPETEDPTETE